MKKGKNTVPVIIVIFGATGDLSKRKLIPAFFNLYLDGYMPDQFAIIGLGRTELDDEEFRNRLHQGLVDFSRNGNPEEEQWNRFCPNITYFRSNINDADAYHKLSQKLDALDSQWGKRQIFSNSGSTYDIKKLTHM
jgi:glucose-6-phosphate 1-dehydrogenase